MLKATLYFLTKSTLLLQISGNSEADLESSTKYFRQNLVFMRTIKVPFLFFRSFLLVLTKSSFWDEDYAPGYNSIKLYI